MLLTSFDHVYDVYCDLVERSVLGDVSQAQTYKLLEAYALATEAVETKKIVRTSAWDRQSGATTATVSLVLANDGVVMLTNNLRSARLASAKIVDAYPEQHVQQVSVDFVWGIIHEKIWWMSGIANIHDKDKPKLVVVDSVTAWVKNRDDILKDVHDTVNCGILVLQSSYQVGY